MCEKISIVFSAINIIKKNSKHDGSVGMAIPFSVVLMQFQLIQQFQQLTGHRRFRVLENHQQ